MSEVSVTEAGLVDRFLWAFKSHFDLPGVHTRYVFAMLRPFEAAQYKLCSLRPRGDPASHTDIEKATLASVRSVVAVAVAVGL